jgi:hypothetical protein
VQVNHKPIWLPELISVRAGDAYSLRILGEGEIRDVILTKQTVANRRWFAGTLSYLLVSLTYLLTAVVVSIMQPRPRITRLAWAALSGEAVTLLCMLMRPYEAFLAGGSYLYLFLHAVGRRSSPGVLIPLLLASLPWWAPHQEVGASGLDALRMGNWGRYIPSLLADSPLV